MNRWRSRVCKIGRQSGSHAKKDRGHHGRWCHHRGKERIREKTTALYGAILNYEGRLATTRLRALIR